MENREIAPDAVELISINGAVLRVRFDNGEIRDFDAEKELFHRKSYSTLKDQRVFNTARIEYGTIAWADGSDLDPEWLYEASTPVSN